jgi:hypothetical protein
VPLKSVVKSLTPEGIPVSRVTMELTDRPCRICPGDFRPGSAYVIECVNRCLTFERGYSRTSFGHCCCPSV